MPIDADQKLQLESGPGRLVVFLLLGFLLSASESFAAPTRLRHERAPWSESMNRDLPERLCRQGSYYLTCYDLSLKFCRERAQKAIRRCLNENYLFEASASDVSASLQTARTKSFGLCVGESLADEWRDRLKPKDRCQSLQAWR